MTDELDPTAVTEIVGDAAEEGPPAEAESEDDPAVTERPTTMED